MDQVQAQLLKVFVTKQNISKACQMPQVMTKLVMFKKKKLN